MTVPDFLNLASNPMVAAAVAILGTLGIQKFLELRKMKIQPPIISVLTRSQPEIEARPELIRNEALRPPPSADAEFFIRNFEEDFSAEKFEVIVGRSLLGSHEFEICMEQSKARIIRISRDHFSISDADGRDYLGIEIRYAGLRCYANRVNLEARFGLVQGAETGAGHNGARKRGQAASG